MMPPTFQTVLSPEELARIGLALYGDQWRTPLARDLGMSERSLRYMASGDRGISVGIARDLLAVVKARRTELGEIVHALVLS
jgi:hypothetical protein